VQRVRDEHVHFAQSSTRQARLPNRVFNVNFEHCLLCGGELEIIAAIEGGGDCQDTHAAGLVCKTAAALDGLDAGDLSSCLKIMTKALLNNGGW